MSPIVLSIYKQAQTVFTFKDLSLLFPGVSSVNLKRRLNYYVKTNLLLNPKPGIYAKDDYNPWELGNRIYTPSYISLETVLAKEGLIFQYYETIFYVSYLTREITVGKDKFKYFKMPGEVLASVEGIENVNGSAIASKERAFLDAVFLYKNYYFDNLASLNWNKVFEISKVYYSKILERRVKDYYGTGQK